MFDYCSDFLLFSVCGKFLRVIVIRSSFASVLTTIMRRRESERFHLGGLITVWLKQNQVNKKNIFIFGRQVNRSRQVDWWWIKGNILIWIKRRLTERKSSFAFFLRSINNMSKKKHSSVCVPFNIDLPVKFPSRCLVVDELLLSFLTRRWWSHLHLSCGNSKSSAKPRRHCSKYEIYSIGNSIDLQKLQTGRMWCFWCQERIFHCLRMKECPSGAVTEREFQSIYSHFFPHGNCQNYARFLFRVLDRRKRAYFTFEVILLLQRVTRN